MNNTFIKKKKKKKKKTGEREKKKKKKKSVYAMFAHQRTIGHAKYRRMLFTNPGT